MTCRYCGVEKTPANEHDECVLADAPWWKMWAEHEWVEKRDETRSASAVRP